MARIMVWLLRTAGVLLFGFFGMMLANAIALYGINEGTAFVGSAIAASIPLGCSLLALIASEGLHLLIRIEENTRQSDESRVIYREKIKGPVTQLKI